jgi:hypothetical protein
MKNDEGRLVSGRVTCGLTRVDLAPFEHPGRR